MNRIEIAIINTDFITTRLNLIKGIFSVRESQALNFRKEQDRLLSACGTYLIRFFAGIENEDDIFVNKFGKPDNDRIHFNISHSGNYCVCAKSVLNTGIDIEKITTDRPSVAKKVFTPDEYTYYENNRINNFFRVWTMKESVMKCTGRGFNLSPSSINTYPAVYSDMIMIEDKAYFLKSFIYNGYYITVCSEKNIDSISFTEYK